MGQRGIAGAAGSMLGGPTLRGSSLGATLGIALGNGVGAVSGRGIGALADIVDTVSGVGNVLKQVSEINKSTRSPVWEIFDRDIMSVHENSPSCRSKSITKTINVEHEPA